MPSFNWRLALQSGYSPEEIQAHLDKRGLSGAEARDEALIERQLGGKPMLPYSYAPDLDMPPPAAAPPPLMSGPPASVPGSVPQTGERRNMSLTEAQALLSEQGIQPVLTPPMSLKDLAMEPIYSFLTEAELPPALLQTVRYKRPGVSALARQAAELYHGTPRVDPIGRKATVFHATGPENVETILKAGEIVPNPQQMQRLGGQSWRDVQRLRPIKLNESVPQEVVDQVIERARQDPNANRILSESGPLPENVKGYDIMGLARGLFGIEDADRVFADLGYRFDWNKGDPGVSVSRVPRVASKGTRAVSFVLDPEKMPPARPFTEPGYRKTRPATVGPAWTGADTEHNPVFEFEDRTYNTAIPTSAVREMWVDRSALPTWELTGPREPALQRIRALSEQYGVPLREFKTGREMHRGRLSDLVRKKRK